MYIHILEQLGPNDVHSELHRAKCYFELDEVHSLIIFNTIRQEYRIEPLYDSASTVVCLWEQGRHLVASIKEGTDAFYISKDCVNKVILNINLYIENNS